LRSHKSARIDWPAEEGLALGRAVGRGLGSRAHRAKTGITQPVLPIGGIELIVAEIEKLEEILDEVKKIRRMGTV